MFNTEKGASGEYQIAIMHIWRGSLSNIPGTGRVQAFSCIQPTRYNMPPLLHLPAVRKLLLFRLRPAIVRRLA
jgi:hypothetical protein